MKSINNFINSYFDQVYVINLDIRTDRMKIVDTLLTEYNINYKRISGVYLKNKYEDVPNVHTKTSSLGIVGCLLSHLKCLQDSKDNNYNRVLVLEDDIKFLDDHIKRIDFKTLWDDIQTVNWDLFYLGATFNDKLKKISAYLDEPTGEVWATQSIGYNKQIRDKILDSMPQDPDFYMKGNRHQNVVPIDVILQKSFTYKKRIAVNPIVCIQNDTPSDIVQPDLFQDNGEYQLVRWHRNRSL
jgi:GR25 family glycosyltransferase involved in LPS biosynthesis